MMVGGIVLKPVQTVNTAEAIAHQIIRLIGEGVLKAGDKLPPEVELVKQLGVGRSSVREAKRLLAAKGVIDPQVARGTYIRELRSQVFDDELLQALLARETLLDLQEARELLEAQIAPLAAQRATADDLATMQDWIDQMERAAPDPRTYDLGVEFHRSIAAATHNQVLIRLYDVICGLLLQYQRPLYVEFADVEAELHEHRMLLDAIRARELERARRLIKEHVSDSKDFVVEVLAKSDGHDGSRGRTRPRRRA